MKAVRWALLLLAGCGGDAQMELTAADAIDAVAGQMAVTIDEYHRDVSRSDDAREAGAVAAFVARVRADAADDAGRAARGVEGHAAAGDSESGAARRDAAVSGGMDRGAAACG